MIDIQLICRTCRKRQQRAPKANKFNLQMSVSHIKILYELISFIWEEVFSCICTQTQTQTQTVGLVATCEWPHSHQICGCINKKNHLLANFKQTRFFELHSMCLMWFDGFRKWYFFYCAFVWWLCATFLTNRITVSIRKRLISIWSAVHNTAMLVVW